MAYPNYVWCKVAVPPLANLDEYVIDQMIRDFAADAKDYALDNTWNIDDDFNASLDDDGKERYRDFGPGKGLIPLLNGKITVMTMTREDPDEFLNLIRNRAEKYGCRLYDSDVAVNDCDTYWVDDKPIKPF